MIQGCLSGGGSIKSGRSNKLGMAHSQSFASRSRRPRSANLGQAANGQWHSLGSDTGAPWRDMPERYGNWNSVFVRFTRWSKIGVWDAAFETLANLGPPGDKEHAIDSTIVRAHQHAAGVKGGIKIGKRSVARAAASRGNSNGIIHGIHGYIGENRMTDRFVSSCAERISRKYIEIRFAALEIMGGC